MGSWFKKNFITGYSIYEILFLWGMTALQVAVSLASPTDWLSFAAGVAGVISVVLCAKGKLLFYFIGFIQTISYLFLAYQNRFYGEVLENIFYFITMIWGIFEWKKHMIKNEDGTQDVSVLKFTPKQWALSIASTIFATVGMGYWLNSIGSAQPYTDAATNVLAIFAQLLMVWRYREQWLWWLVIDVLCIKMWFVAGNWSMVAMYVAWTINCLYGWYTWTKLENKASE